MRFQVTFEESAVVTLKRTIEVEAPDEAEAIRLARTGEFLELDEDDFIDVARELDGISSAEIDEDGDIVAVRVG